MNAPLGCIALAVLVFYANPIRQGLDLAGMYGFSRLVGATQIAAGIAAFGLLVRFVKVI